MDVLLSLLGCRLDAKGRGTGRWGVWRPSVALAMQEDLHFDRYHLVYQPEFARLKDEVAADIRAASPDTEVIPEEISIANPWDFEEVYAKLYDLSRRLDFSAEDHRYYIHITTGSHVEQICLFLLNESHHLPGKLIQTQPSTRECARGTYNVIDLDLSQYDQIAKRFEAERRDDLALYRRKRGDESVCNQRRHCGEKKDHHDRPAAAERRCNVGDGNTDDPDNGIHLLRGRDKCPASLSCTVIRGSATEGSMNSNTGISESSPLFSGGISAATPSYASAIAVDASPMNLRLNSGVTLPDFSISKAMACIV